MPRGWPKGKPRIKRLAVIQPFDTSIRYIPLTQGLYAIVDVADYDWLNQWCWCATKTRNGFIAARRVTKGITISMHTALTGARETDHWDHNTLNNCRSNLRPCTRSQNHANSKRRSDNNSGLKGVSFCKATGRWRADARINGRGFNLGRYDTKEEAYASYCEFMRTNFGEFAYLFREPDKR
jgi:hypothetical protein